MAFLCVLCLYSPTYSKTPHVPMAKSTKKSKKYFNRNQQDKNLKSYLAHQTKLKKHHDALQLNTAMQIQNGPVNTVIQQDFNLPFYGKLSYLYGFLSKYMVFTLFFSLLSMFCLFIYETFINPNSFLDSNELIAHFWYFLFLIPFATLLICIPFTVYRKNLIQNYRVSENSFDIIYANQHIKSISYQDIRYVTSMHTGVANRIFLISFYCHKTQKNIINFPLFIHYMSYFHIYPVKNEQEIISAFLQQLSIKNKYASIDGLFLFFYHIDETTYVLDHNALWRDKRFDYIFWFILLSAAIGCLVYASLPLFP